MIIFFHFKIILPPWGLGIFDNLLSIAATASKHLPVLIQQIKRKT
jgi:hypothetical protein